MKINNNYILLLCVAALGLLSFLSIRKAMTPASVNPSASFVSPVGDSTTAVERHSSSPDTVCRLF